MSIGSSGPTPLTSPGGGSTPGTPSAAPRATTKQSWWKWWKNLRFGKSIGNQLKETVQNGNVPYVTVCSVSSAKIGDLEFADFPGLLSCCAVEDNVRGSVVCSYWSNGESLDLHGKPLLQVLQGANEIAAGRVAEVRVKPRSFTERFPVWTFVITISAVAGAFTALWEDGEHLVEAPDVSVTFKRDNRRNFESSEVPVVSFAVTDQCRFTPVDVRILGAMQRVGDPAPQMQELARLSRIEAGKASDFDALGSNLAPPMDARRPQEYVLRIVVHASAGLWRRERQFAYTSSSFKRWQRVTWTDPEKSRVSPNSCLVSGTLNSGLSQEQTLTASITVGIAGGIDSITTTVLGHDQTSSDPSDTGQVRRQQFTTPKLPPFQVIPFSIRVNSRAMSDAVCTQIAHDLAQNNNLTFQ
jgi:hypothetical protein